MKILKDRANNNKNSIRASGYVCKLIKAGQTLKQIADTLNKEGFLTVRGKAFAATTVARLYKRYCI